MLAYFSILIFFTFVDNGIAAKQCDPVPEMENFPVSNISGPWYGYELSIKATAEEVDCLMQNWSIVEEMNGSDRTVMVEMTHQAPSKEFNVDDITMSQVSTTSLFNVRSKPALVEAPAWTIISTDYDNYLTLYICKRILDKNGIYMVLTRRMFPDQDVVQKAHDSLAEIGFPIDNLHKVNQKDCPE